MKTSKFFTKFLTFGFIFAASLFVGSSSVFAGSARLTWNANTESNLSGYKIYYDTVSRAGTCPSGYASSVNVATNANTGYWFDSLTEGRTYYFQVTALNSSGLESACSVVPGEVSKVVTYRGDINSTPDRAVNMNDFTILASNYGLSVQGPANKADINRDGIVNMNDFTLLSTDYGKSF